jgi:hypothetical protein
LIGVDGSGIAFGGQLLGFDSTNRHRYYLSGSYNTQLSTADGYLLYSNRSFGPTLDFSADILTTNIDEEQKWIGYSRQVDLSLTLSYPFLTTYSNFTPMLSFSLQQLTNYQKNTNPSSLQLLSESHFIPILDEFFSFSNLETSPLSITSEGGRIAQFGSRVYFLNSNETQWKLFLIEQEHIRLADHLVFMPSVKGMWVNQYNPNYPWSNTVVSGRSLENLLSPFSGNNLNQLSIRGYPEKTFYARAATALAAELRFPIARIFRGYGTNPFFLDNLYGLAFAEATYFPYTTSNVILTSAGGGLRLSTELFFVPITFSTEYHYGFNQKYGGKPDFFFQIIASGLQI